MKNSREKPAGLRISQLARLADVPIPTIKYYLKEGLLPRPTKTGRTMSYYDLACVENVRLIKRLRTERFFPLSVIKRIIQSGATADGELALGEALLHVPAAPPHAVNVSRREIAARTGYSARKIDQMESLGLISPRLTSRGRRYDAADCQVITLIRQREQAGLPFDYSLEMMSIYRRHIQRIVQDDAKLFIRRMLPTSSPADAARHIREGDKALGAFMPLIKAKLVRAHAEKMLNTLNLAPQHIKEILRFRSIARSPSTNTLACVRSGEPFPRVFLSAIRKSGNPPSIDPPMATLARSLLLLIKGDLQQAQARLRRPNWPAQLSPFASALEALARYGTVSGMPGVFAPIHAITAALSGFESSRSQPPGSDIWLLTSYIRGAGLAVIPEVFDTRRQGAEDLKAVAHFVSNRGGKADDLWNRLLDEVKLKSLYFLAQMYLHDDDIEAARTYLHTIKESGERNFYWRWAVRHLKNPSFERSAAPVSSGTE